ncbi:hypothetical protein ACOSQ3_003689 [Xanthoceras sorbifolium]
MIHEHHFNLPTPRQPTHYKPPPNRQLHQLSSQPTHFTAANAAPSKATQHPPPPRQLLPTEQRRKPHQIRAHPQHRTPLSVDRARKSAARKLTEQNLAQPPEKRGKGSAGTMDPKILGYPVHFLPKEAKEGPR